MSASSPYGSLSLLSTLLNSEVIKWIAAELLDLWRSSRFDGTYKVHEHEVQLGLIDDQGKQAIYQKRQQVVFLHNDITAIQDQAWGDGDLFADYKCSPGIPVDTYKEGYRYRILISLRGTKNRGDEETFHIERTIVDGFITPVGNFQTQIDHPTARLSISVIFPGTRLPKKISLIEQNTRHTTLVGEDSKHELPDGRVQILWKIHRPRLYEAYNIRWEW